MGTKKGALFGYEIQTSGYDEIQTVIWVRNIIRYNYDYNENDRINHNTEQHHYFNNNNYYNNYYFAYIGPPISWFL